MLSRDVYPEAVAVSLCLRCAQRSSVRMPTLRQLAAGRASARSVVAILARRPDLSSPGHNEVHGRPQCPRREKYTESLGNDGLADCTPDEATESLTSTTLRQSAPPSHGIRTNNQEGAASLTALRGVKKKCFENFSIYPVQVAQPTSPDSPRPYPCPPCPFPMVPIFCRGGAIRSVVSLYSLLGVLAAHHLAETPLVQLSILRNQRAWKVT
jgi:hypothetical protein